MVTNYSLSPCTVECVPITAQYSVTRYLINGKFQLVNLKYEKCAEQEMS